MRKVSCPLKQNGGMQKSIEVIRDKTITGFRLLSVVFFLIAGACRGSNTAPTEQSVPTSTDPFAARSFQEVAGRWSGTVVQSGITYSVELRGDANGTVGSRVAEVNYPTLACSGFWVGEEAGHPDYRALERITNGTTRCLDRVEVRFTVSSSPRRLTVRYYVGGIVGAMGTLTPS